MTLHRRGIGKPGASLKRLLLFGLICIPYYAVVMHLLLRSWRRIEYLEMEQSMNDTLQMMGSYFPFYVIPVLVFLFLLYKWLFEKINKNWSRILALLMLPVMLLIICALLILFTLALFEFFPNVYADEISVTISSSP